MLIPSTVLPVAMRPSSRLPGFGSEGYSAAVGFGGLDEKCCLADEVEEVLITADQQVSLATLSQVEEGLIVWIAAQKWACHGWLDHFAVWEVVNEELAAIGGDETKLGVLEDAGELGSCGAWR